MHKGTGVQTFDLCVFGTIFPDFGMRYVLFPLLIAAKGLLK